MNSEQEKRETGQCERISRMKKKKIQVKYNIRTIEESMEVRGESGK
jgi:hypothetical protein